MQAVLRFLGSSVAGAMLFAAADARAFNNSNLTYSAITTNLGAVLEWPGDSGTNNTLSIVNGAVVIDTGHWFGGINGVANYNFAIVSGNGSLWTNNSGNSFIGRYGGGNQVIVTNNGAWVSANALIGSLVASASNNSVLVTGSGSEFKSGDIVLGGGGAVNTFTVRDLGTLKFANFTVGEGSIGNQWVITNGGKSYGTTHVFVGAQNNLPSGSNNTLLVTGSGSVLTNGFDMFVGRFSAFNQMTVSDGGLVVNRIGFIGSNTTDANSNSVVVTGANSIWTNTSSLIVGGAGNGNRLTVTDTGMVYAASVTLGSAAGGVNNRLIITNGGRMYNAGNLILNDNSATFASNNLVVVTGTGSILSNGANFLVGRYSTGNRLEVRNGGLVVNGQGLIGATAASASNNSVLVTDSGSVWSNTSTIAMGTFGNTLTVRDGGTVYAADVTIGSSASGVGNQVIITNGGKLFVTGGLTLAPNATPGASNNLLKITGPASRVSAGGLVVGAGAAGNQMIIEEGGSLSSAGVVRIGNQAPASNNLVVVTGSGSVWSNTSSIVVGSVGTGNRMVVADGGAVFAPDVLLSEDATSTGNSILVKDRGLLQANTLSVQAAGNSISNIGGIYQFTTATPGITPGRVFITNGTVSFRGITTAPTGPVANLSYQGNNTLRLNNATNTSLTSYTFESADITGNPSNYRKLELINNSRWQSGSLTIGTNGAVSADAGSRLTLTGNFTINRASNPSGDFDLASSEVHFSGGGIHTNAITGQDLGNNGTLGFPDGFTAPNFSYGKLTLASTNDRIQFVMGDGGLSNALYVTTLDLGAFAGQFSSVSNMVTSLLFTPDEINIYYMYSGPGNDYLNNLTYRLADSPGGGMGGFLMPAIPEPSTVSLLTLAACAMFWRRTQQK